ncbi:MAG: hypothetical protein RRB22_01530 [Gammaproteobacteria bacterium]|nr:hypothetical protein [Gammaproteobacteria bacterium]
MSSKDSNKQIDPVIPSSDETPTAQADTGKRRLLKGLMATAPVVMAVSSKPALANFCTVSGFLSGNLSHHDAGQRCGGKSPGYWKNNYDRHYDPEAFKQVKFRQEFGVLWYGSGGPWDADISFLTILNFEGNEDAYKFGFHAVAAYLNAVNISGYGLTPNDVAEMVAQIAGSGVYTHPGTGKTLDAQDFVEFIEQTYH